MVVDDGMIGCGGVDMIGGCGCLGGCLINLCFMDDDDDDSDDDSLRFES